ncbi:MAG: hypothetical protein ACTH1Z_07485 [Ancrocorticia sp.]|uniref:hypothetical protein n=1 Tax=Ancrocorticia sp. TaxID=2593684 RepID=UPI003F911B08
MSNEKPFVSAHATDAPVTPAFVVDEESLARQAESFTAAMAAVWPTGIVSYSVKTNSLPWIVSWMAKRGIWAEVVSDHEYRLALALGHSPDKIVFNGPAKSRETMLAALSTGAIVNIDSRRELRWVLEYAKNPLARSIKVGVRVNWDVDAECPGDTTSGAAGLRFGFDVSNGDLASVLDSLKEQGVSVAALHLHVTSLSRAIGTYQSAARVAASIVEQHRLSLDYLDIGGGFYGGENPAFPSPEEYLVAIRDGLDGAIDPATTRLVIEPGSALVAVAVEFHTSVLDSKPAGDHVIVVTDGSRTNIDPFFRKESYEYSIRTTGRPALARQVICGFTCLDNDRLMTLEEAPELSEGDTITYKKVGSYTMCFNPLFINQLPTVYVRHCDGTLGIARHAWGEKEYLAANDWNA